jgi:5-methyltetrahydropteroyltriglutamate--homocysteine methyltransferase
MAAITPSRTPRSPARAEPVGSLLRTRAITDQYTSIYDGETTALRAPVVRQRPGQVAELNRRADEAIVGLVQRQIDAGLDVVTDGEMRRATFLGSLFDAVEGMKPAPERIVSHDDAGQEEHVWLNDPVMDERLRKTFSPGAEEATFLRSLTDFPFKVTLPAPSYFFCDLVSIEGSAYAHKLDLVQDIVAIEKILAAEAIAAGARWIQFDFPIYPALVAASTSSDFGSMIEGVGESREWLLDRALAADTAVTADLPDDVTIAMHLCRGNFEGGFWSGSLAPIAERMFNELPHQRFLFEWEDVDREGGYEPIKYVPKDRIMAMGIVSTKTPELETDDEILGRIEEAGKYLDVSQLALCPQCGFASLFADHLVEAEDAQWRKLELIGRVADRVWGPN